MRRVVFWLGWWLVLFWLWLLLAGEWNRQEWIAAAGAAAIGATLGEVARTRAGARGGSLRVLAGAPSALAMVFVDFGILVWALAASVARRSVVRGEFRERTAPHTDALTALLASFSPNAYVVEIDAKRVLLHDLVPYARSEEPVA